MDQIACPGAGSQIHQVLYMAASDPEAWTASRVAGQSRDIAAAGREGEEKG